MSSRVRTIAQGWENQSHVAERWLHAIPPEPGDRTKVDDVMHQFTMRMLVRDEHFTGTDDTHMSSSLCVLWDPEDCTERDPSERRPDRVTHVGTFIINIPADLNTADYAVLKATSFLVLNPLTQRKTKVWAQYIKAFLSVSAKSRAAAWIHATQERRSLGLWRSATDMVQLFEKLRRITHTNFDESMETDLNLSVFLKHILMEDVRLWKTWLEGDERSSSALYREHYFQDASVEEADTFLFRHRMNMLWWLRVTCEQHTWEPVRSRMIMHMIGPKTRSIYPFRRALKRCIPSSVTGRTFDEWVDEVEEEEDALTNLRPFHNIIGIAGGVCPEDASKMHVHACITRGTRWMGEVIARAHLHLFEEDETMRFSVPFRYLHRTHIKKNVHMYARTDAMDVPELEMYIQHRTHMDEPMRSWSSATDKEIEKEGRVGVPMLKHLLGYRLITPSQLTTSEGDLVNTLSQSGDDLDPSMLTSPKFVQCALRWATAGWALSPRAEQATLMKHMLKMEKTTDVFPPALLWGRAHPERFFSHATSREEDASPWRDMWARLLPFQQDNVEWMLAQEARVLGNQLLNGILVRDADGWARMLWDVHHASYGDADEAGVRGWTQVRGGILCDDVGLGKTVQVIALIARTLPDVEHTPYDRGDMRRFPSVEQGEGEAGVVAHMLSTSNPNGIFPAGLRTLLQQKQRVLRAHSRATLLLCPTPMQSHWKRELETWAPHLDVVHVTLKSFRFDVETLDRIVRADVVLCSGTSKLLLQQLQLISWHRVVLDESHMMLRTGALVECMECMVTTRRWCVSATPMTTFDVLVKQLAWVGVDVHVEDAKSKHVMYKQKTHGGSLHFWCAVNQVMRGNMQSTLRHHDALHLPPKTVHTLCVPEEEERHISPQEKGAWMLTLQTAKDLMHKCSMKRALRQWTLGSWTTLVPRISVPTVLPPHTKRMTWAAMVQDARRNQRLSEDTLQQRMDEPCPVCWVDESDALMLPCKHTVCTSCWKRLSRRICPMCRARAPVAYMVQDTDAIARQRREQERMQGAPWRPRLSDIILEKLHELRRVQDHCLVFVTDCAAAQWLVDALRHQEEKEKEKTQHLIPLQCMRHQKDLMVMEKALNRSCPDASAVMMPKPKMWIMRYAHAGMGMHLIRARRVVCLDTHDESLIAQAVGRAHRMGQTRPVDVYVMEDTLHIPFLWPKSHLLKEWKTYIDERIQLLKDL